ncbi:MAG: AAA family ATPase [Deltaproteobacteria bacterium]|nr:AAA family ATPase [Deltaproteobacteria bacterium]
MRIPFKQFVEEKIEGDAILIACGLPATNKTETTEVVAQMKGYKMLRTDLIRRDVLKGEDIFDEKVASNMDKRTLVYDTMFSLADELSSQGAGVILDATFITQSLRRRAAGVAAKNRKTFIIQQTQCPEEHSLYKISKRTKEHYESNALTEQAYLNNKEKFEPVDLDDLKGRYPDLRIVHLLVDTASDSDDGWFVIGEVER